MAIGVQQFPILSPEQESPFGNLFQDSLKKFTAGINAGFLPKEKQAALQKSLAEALIKHAEAQYAPQMQEAKLATEQSYPDYYRSASAQNFANANKTNTMTPIEAAKQNILNKFLPQREQAEISEAGARSNYYNQGGGRGSVGSKDDATYKYLVSTDNPQLNEAQAREAANALADGKFMLADGTPINPMSSDTRRALDRSIRATTTAKIITSGVQGNQSEAEINKISQFAQEGLRPYADTFAGYSPAQIKDSFSSKPEDQKRLGRFIAAQQLQYEIAQNEIKLANGEPGVTSTHELMKLGQQLIKARYPKLSGEARAEAQNYFIKALKEGLKARKAVGVGASSVLPERDDANSQEAPQETRQVGNEILVKINGQWFHKE